MRTFSTIRTLPDLLTAARTAEHRPFLRCTADGPAAVGEFLNRVDSFAAWMRGQGIRRWDRVGIFLPKCRAEAEATFAAVRMGAVFVNLSSKTPVARAAEILVDCGLRCLVTTPRSALELRAAAARSGCLLVTVGRGSGADPGTTAWASIPESPFVAEPGTAPVDNDLAAILHTSGSTGRSKGVMISHRNLVDATFRVADYLGQGDTDRILSVLPLSAPWGVLQLTTALLCGSTVVLQPVAFPVEIARAVREQEVTGLACMPPTWIQLVELLLDTGGTLPGLRYVTSSGGVIPPRTLEAFPRVFPNAQVFLTYGLTEAFRTTLLPPEWFSRKPGSLGRACPNVDIFVVDPGRGICGPGQRGELVHRGAAVTMGYWNDPEATAAVYRLCPELRPHIGDEVVHYSGDLVEIDADGFLWFVGRKDSLIKVAGYRVSAEEIEVAATQYSHVLQAVAYGVPDPVFGQAVHLAVEPPAGTPFDPKPFLAHCREILPTHMVPRHLTVWDGPMPRTGTGKIDRDAVIRAPRPARAVPDSPVSKTDS
jgi:acyl-CoA synthetase (AMP-forming)/AMP-acid ligase II